VKNLMKHYNELVMSVHALDEFKKATDLCYTPNAVIEMVLESKLVKHEEAEKHGFHSSYYGRANKGIKSWYAIHKQFEWKILFVMTESQEDSNKIVVVTVLHNKCPIIKRYETDPPPAETAPELETFVNMIQHNAAKFVCRKSYHVAVFDVPHGMSMYRVEYDKITKNATLLESKPYAALKENI
jgi:hypothetical protein